MPGPADDTARPPVAQGPALWSDAAGSTQRGDVVPLVDAEARHATGALRLRAGDPITLLDGRGGVASATMATVGRDAVTVRVVDSQRLAPLRPRLELFVAPPKGPRLEAMINQLVQVGVDAVTLLDTQRSVASPSEHRQRRLDKAVIEACKQCGRAWAMDIAGPIAFDHAIEAATRRGGSGALKLLASPAGAASPFPGPVEPVEHAEAWIGPEGGFTAEEHASAVAAGLTPWRLGPYVMRIETAAVAAAAILRGRP